MIRTLLFLSMASLAAAQSAQMTFEGDNGREPMPVDSASVSVVLAGGVAETTLTLSFLNPTNRMLEGEFVMPLPEGATVSSYALEVNGELREAVSVEKERARNAYESIKRKMVDPGLVEREAGNVYRTRVFPVMPGKTKGLRIGYVETLGDAGYRLPLGFPGKVKEFSVNVSHTEGTLKIDAPDALRFDAGKAVAEDVEINGELRIKWEREKAAIRYFGDAGYRWVSGFAPEDLPRTRRAVPEVIELFWDASDSARAMDREAIVGLLGAYFEKCGNVKVKLRLIRNVQNEGGEFEVINGEWAALRGALENVFYDGATDFTACRETGGMAIVVSDHLPRELAMKDTVAIISGSRVGMTPSAMQVIDLNKGNESQRLDELLFYPTSLRMLREQATDLVRFSGRAGDPFQIFTSEQRSRKVEIVFESGGETRSLEATDGGSAGTDLAHRLWAQNRLSRMEAGGSDESEITDFAMQHGLVSDFTSFIVLEKIEDYVKYRIPPPEQDWLRRYETMVKNEDEALSGSRAFALTALRRDWALVLNWHQRKFPWVDAMLYPPLKRIGIWMKATEKVFSAEERDGENFDRIRNWYESALKLIKAKENLPNGEAFVLWAEKIGQSLEQKAALWRKDLPPHKGPLAVSVEGFVKNPGKVKSEGPLTLKDAIRSAGGVRAPGSGARVSLFRQGERITYNLLSDAYQPVALRPGDMLVVRKREDEGLHSFDDPFSAGPSEPEDMSKRPAVVEEPGESWAEEADYSLSEAGGAPSPEMPIGIGGGDVAFSAEKEQGTADMRDFEKVLADGGDAAAAYAELKGATSRPDSFYVLAARALGKNESLRKQVLSNLMEGDPSEARLRRYAMWLAEFGWIDSAIDSLKNLKSKGAMLDLARMYLRQAEAQADDARLHAGRAAVRAYETIAKEEERGGLGVVALIERNAWLSRNSEEEWDAGADTAGIYRQNIAVDIRIVIASDRPVQISVVEPGGTSLPTYFDVFSPCGGRLDKVEAGQSTYMMRRALPGNYKVTLFSENGDATVQIGFFTNFGLANQTVVWKTMLVKNREREDGTFEMKFE